MARRAWTGAVTPTRGGGGPSEPAWRTRGLAIPRIRASGDVPTASALPGPSVVCHTPLEGNVRTFAELAKTDNLVNVRPDRGGSGRDEAAGHDEMLSGLQHVEVEGHDQLPLDVDAHEIDLPQMFDAMLLDKVDTFP